MNGASITLKSLARLQREHVRFTIDSYQRGFRWTEVEITDLLNDVREFALAHPSDESAFYCLQPVVVTRASGGLSWNVIDGQQRLTTLYLFYCCYSWLVPPAYRYNLLPFSLSYRDKPRMQACLAALSDKEYIISRKFAAETAEYEEDIDCHYLLSAYRCIARFLRELLRDPSARAGVDLLKDTFDRRVKLIWYEVPDCGPDGEAALFTRLNTGRIPLTDAELVRAMLLQRSTSEAAQSLKADSSPPLRLQIPGFWSGMEAELSDPRFWSFLTGGRDDAGIYASPTRMDLILHVTALCLKRNILANAGPQHPGELPWLGSVSFGGEHFSFHVFSAWRELLQHREDEAGTGGSAGSLLTIWEEILRTYRLFRSWYENSLFYHRIGFLTLTSSLPAAEVLAGLLCLACGELPAASASACPPEEYANSSGFFSEGLAADRLADSLLRLVSRDLFGVFKPSRSDVRDLVTGLTYPKDSHKIRQVLLLFNIACTEAEDHGRRFPLELYRDVRLNWDLDHIHAVADSSSGEADHSIGNLTLLNSDINRISRNDTFPAKRKTVLERSAKGIFIPPGTRKVFLKRIPGSSATLRWDDLDKKAYTEEIIRMLCLFLNLEDAAYES